MALSPGEKLGPYKCIGPIGKGGMGEVYRAHDPKLNRDVAIKVLPAALANDAGYLARFQREAQTLAALNHPNIAMIFGIEERAIVMELVEGSTLKGPMPLEEVLPVARQIAEALEAAHERGIIHRDLKPGNIKLTPEGVVKILDFGLAKAVNERPAQTGSDSPTMTLRATEAGLIVGTAAYMSPEQATGKNVDRRADIWSFGVVLYELLTGKRLFDGESVTHILADVVRAPIDLTGVPLRDLLGRCLGRNLRTRLAHIAEARIAIERYAPEETKAPVAKAGWWPWAVAAVGIVIAGAAGWILRPSARALPTMFEILPPEDSRFAAINSAGGSAISPDGRMVAFVAVNAKGTEILYVRSLDSLMARELAGTESAGRPFWSPDGRSLGFVAGGKLKRIDLARGAPITLRDARNPRGGSWNEDGVILFGDQTSPIRRIPASGGTPAPVTQLNEKDTAYAHYFPQFLPGGKRFLFLVRHQAAEKAGVFVGSLDGTAPVWLMPSGYKAEYDAVSGRLLYLLGTGALMARKLELDPPRLVGDPVAIAEGVRGAESNGYAEFSVSGNGAVAYGRGSSVTLSRFAWRGRSGKVLGTVGQAMEFGAGSVFSLSPDGGHVAFSRIVRGAGDVWVTELTRGVSTRLSFNGGVSPRWSPDGRSVYYSTPGGIRRKAIDGSGDEVLVVKARFCRLRIQRVSGQQVPVLRPGGHPRASADRRR